MLQLTPKQYEIARAFADGFSTTQIATHLNLNVETINPVLKVVGRKFGTHEMGRQVIRAFLDEYELEYPQPTKPIKPDAYNFAPYPTPTPTP